MYGAGASWYSIPHDMLSEMKSIIRNNQYHFLPYLAIILFVISYYYFFTERLPWFWYDDILRIEWAEKRSLLQTLADVFNFTSLTFGIDRPVFALYIKFCNFIFGENPHYWRMIKIILFSITACLLFYLSTKHKGNKIITVTMLCVLSTFPAVFVGNAWISDSETLELLFTVSSFVVFFKLVSASNGTISLRFILLSVLLLILIIVADESKVTAIITPFILMTYLLLTKNRNISLYIVMIVSILTVIPYAVFSGNAFLYTSSPSSYLTNKQYAQLFWTFINQMWPLVVFVLILGFLAKSRGSFKNTYTVFSSVWLVYEILFFVFYPANEMRYLFSSLAAAMVFLSSLVSNVLNVSQGRLLRIAKYGFLVMLLIMLGINVAWSYSFRGSMTIVVLADKEMRFINKNYRNSLCLYEEQNEVYYSRNAANNLYVNIHPKYASNAKYSGIYATRSPKLEILHPEKYENIFLLISQESQRTYCDYSFPGLSVDSEIPNTLYDAFQRRVNFTIYCANLYNTNLTEVCQYPAYGDICKLK